VNENQHKLVWISHSPTQNIENKHHTSNRKSLHKGVKMQKGTSVLIWWSIMHVPSTETTHNISNKSHLHAYHSVNVNTKNIERVRQKLEDASCVWNPFYDFSVDRVVRVQRRFIGLLCVVSVSGHA
jgi:hypothetical protein